MNIDNSPLDSVGECGRFLREGGSSVELVLGAIERVAAVDRGGPELNAVPVLDPNALQCAAARDRDDRSRGPLDGVPVVVKDSFAVQGLSMAAGSPAFAGTTAAADATAITRLREAGAVIVGKTNMPPLAIGGGQPGVYGRTRSPFNPDYLAAAWHSGSSIGTGVAVAAGVAPIGLAEETVSSGRSPASNNGLFAYTPSWGVISSAGNWPLHRYRDVCVPLARTIEDLWAMSAVLAGPDDGDVWRDQGVVGMDDADAVIEALKGATVPTGDLRGTVVGVPSLYANQWRNGVEPIPVRRSILKLWDEFEEALADAGATVRRVSFPLVERYERRRPSGDESFGALVSDAWTAHEIGALTAHDWRRHLTQFAPEGLEVLDRGRPEWIRPDDPRSMDIRIGSSHPGRDRFDFAEMARIGGHARDVVLEERALEGIVESRRVLFDDWMRAQGLDVLAFPANHNIGAWDADVSRSSAEAAWADGAVFSTGNHVIRRFGLPTVTVPMGVMGDTGMPVGATFCASPGRDVSLFSAAAAASRTLSLSVRAPLAATWNAGRPVRGVDVIELEGSVHVATSGRARCTVHTKSAVSGNESVAVCAEYLRATDEGWAGSDVVLPQQGRAPIAVLRDTAPGGELRKAGFVELGVERDRGLAPVSSE